MADRTVSVKLRAEVAGYIAGTRDAARATRDLQTETVQAATKNKQAMTDVGTAALGIGAAVGAGVGFAVKSFADFDKAMSAVQAATHETTENMNALRSAAMEAGARTAFSATEAAEGIEALAKAGISTTAILNGGLNGALDLAAAGGLGVGEAAEIAATAMTQFRLSGEKVPHVADLLAAAAGKAQGDVTDMGMALKQAGLVADQTGLTIEETTAGLAAFASAGLLGSDAGTSFKSMLQRLTPQSAEAADLMNDLGISAYDAQGNFIGLEGFAGNLKASLANLTVEQRNSALATIFGSDAVRAASVLYSQGAEGIASWTDKVNDTGYAAETAATRLDNLSGDFEALMGSVETALIKTGSAGNDIARGLTQTATSIVNAYGSLPSSLQGTVLGLGGVTAAVALGAGAFLVLLPRIVETRAAMRTLTTEMPRATAAMSGVTRAAAGFAAFTVATQAVNALVLATTDTADGVEVATQRILGSLTDVDAGFAELTTWSEEVGSLEEALKLLADPGLANRLGDIGGEILSFGGNEGSYRRTAIIEQLGAMGDALGKLVTEGRADLAAKKFDEFAVAADKAGMSSEELLDLLPGYSEALAGAANQAQLGTEAQDGLAGATDEVTASIDEQVESMADSFEMTRALTGQILSARDANRGYESAIDAAAEALKENGKTLDITTEKGRANEAALDAIASSANDVLEAMIASNDPYNQVSAALGKQRDALIAAATNFGLTKVQAEQYADKVLRIPPQAATKAVFDGTAAGRSIATIERQLNDLNGRVVVTTVRVDEVLGTTVSRGGPGRITERADGGWIGGNGGPRADDQLLLASTGEFVVNAKDAALNAGLLEAINSGRYARGQTVTGFGAMPAAVSVAAPDLSRLEARMDELVQSHRDSVDAYRRETDRRQTLIRAND